MFPIRHIHQIEMTSRCNLRCRYCPSPHLPRPKIDMTEAYYKQSLRWARHFLVSSIYSDLTDAMEHAKKLERMYDKQQRAEWYEPSNVE